MSRTCLKYNQIYKKGVRQFMIKRYIYFSPKKDAIVDNFGWLLNPVENDDV